MVSTDDVYKSQSSGFGSPLKMPESYPNPSLAVATKRIYNIENGRIRLVELNENPLIQTSQSVDPVEYLPLLGRLRQHGVMVEQRKLFIRTRCSKFAHD